MPFYPDMGWDPNYINIRFLIIAQHNFAMQFS